MESGSGRLQTACRYSAYVTYALLVIFALVAVFFVVVTVAVAVSGEGNGDMSWEEAVTTLVPLTVEMIAVPPALWVLSKMLGTVGSGSSPFSTENAVRLKLIACIILLAFVVYIVSETVLFLALEPEDYAFNIDFNPLLVAVAAYVLSLMFRYGAQLQEESDGTV